jgi:glycerol-3-phosphate dehydrogenase subunit C
MQLLKNFPELYRLQDQSDKSGLAVCAKELRNLIDLCTLCGSCPCKDIRMLVLQAKAAFVDEKGISFSSKMISDVETVGLRGIALSKVVNQLNRVIPVSHLEKGFKCSSRKALACLSKRKFFPLGKKKRPEFSKK